LEYTSPVVRYLFGKNSLFTQANLQLRNFKWSDLEAFQHLLNDIGRHGHRDWAEHAEELRSELEYPRVKPERNIALTMDGDEATAYAIVEPEPNIGRSVIGIGSRIFDLAARKELLDWARERAIQEAPVAHLSTRDNESDFEQLVEQLGWTKIRKYLKLRVTSGIESAPGVVPAGYSLRTMLGLDEVPELTYLQNKAFGEHFGYSPNAEDEIKARLMAPDTGVNDILMIHDSNEQLVAYCWTLRGDHEGTKIGRIGMTGVLPAARGQGLGRAIAEAGFNHLVGQNVDMLELDVDSTNVPAIKVYSSLGFRTSSEVNWWELAL
jgi:mycothiol synthase